VAYPEQETGRLRQPAGYQQSDRLPQTARRQKVAVYAGASSAENRNNQNNLDGQAERMRALCAATGWQVAKVVKECGSAVNDQRPQLLALLADSGSRRIVVDHTDRCSRFGVAYIQTFQTLLQAQGRDLLILNDADEEQADEEQADLMQDLVAIITLFCARPYGRRRASRKCWLLWRRLDAPDSCRDAYSSLRPQRRQSGGARWRGG
jgi:predicted site-specific integrase-resolvase